MTERLTDPEKIPEAVIKPKKRLSFQIVWLIPLIAAIIGGGIAIKYYLQKGTVITITFKTGEGLEAGKTKIKYRDVDVGIVTKVELTDDMKEVVATAELAKDASHHLVEDSRFWIVRPRISGGTVSGLGTLLGGSYIGFDIGKSTKPQRSFHGLETVPPVTADVPGTRFTLHGSDLGSVDVGTPVYFRRIQVGQVTSYKLDESGTGVTFRLFINAPYDKFVKTNTRFWNASGIDLTLNSAGMTLRTQSMVSLLSGGIAFQTFDTNGENPPSDNSTVFTLFANQEEAFKTEENISQLFVMTFKESVRGLTVGAPVDFRGVVIGDVTSINLQYDDKNKEMDMVVGIRFYPRKMLAKMVKSQKNGDLSTVHLNRMVSKGLRAQLKTGNILTGQLYISVDFFPTVAKSSIDWTANPPNFPTTPGSLTELQASLSRILNKIERMPLEEVMTELRAAIHSLDSDLKTANNAIKRVDAETLPGINATLAEINKTMESARHILSTNAPLQQDLRETLHELSRAAQSLRTLTDYLDRHPESLIRGKLEDK